MMGGRSECILIYLQDAWLSPQVVLRKGQYSHKVGSPSYFLSTASHTQ
jgi:hypothetical protein